MNMQEYIALRAEIITRIQLVNTQENTALTAAIGFWGANFALYAIIMAANLPAETVIIASVFQLVLLFSPILLLIPIAKKSGENLYQIVSIASYIEVFYENASIKKAKKEKKILFWENANKLVTKIMDKSKNQWDVYSLNNCYATISFVSTLLFGLETIYLLIVHYDFFSQKHILCAAILMLVLLLTLAIIITVRIYILSSVKHNMIDKKEQIIEIYTKEAVRMGIITKADKP